MTTTDVNFIDNPAAKSGFSEITIDCTKALESWSLSVYSFEWLKDGTIKSTAELSPAEATKRIATEKAIATGQPIPKPILGIGIMDNIEIGTGRAELLTLIDQGHTQLPVHIPEGQEEDFRPFLAETTQKGSVLFYILIAVALLGALSYTIAGTSQSRVDGINEERASLFASELISTSNRIAEATAKLRLSGCLDTQISFDAAKLADHENPSAPSDETCHIFSIAGGGLNYTPLNPGATEDGAATDWIFTGDIAVEGIGTSCTNDSCADLIALATGLSRSTCEQLNKLTGIDTSSAMPSQALASPSPFEGSYDYATTIGNIPATDALFAQNAGCLHNTTTDTHTFYRALIRR